MPPSVQIMTWASMLSSHAIIFMVTTRVLMKNFPEKPESNIIGAIVYAVAVAVALVGLGFLRHSKKVANGQQFLVVAMAVFEAIAALGMVSVILGVAPSIYYGLAASGLLLHLIAFPFKRGQ